MFAGSPCLPFSQQRAKRWHTGDVKTHESYGVTMQSMIDLCKLYEPKKMMLEQVKGFCMPYEKGGTMTPKERSLDSSTSNSQLRLVSFEFWVSFHFGLPFLRLLLLTIITIIITICFSSSTSPCNKIFKWVQFIIYAHIFHWTDGCMMYITWCKTFEKSTQYDMTRYHELLLALDYMITLTIRKGVIAPTTKRNHHQQQQWFLGFLNSWVLKIGATAAIGWLPWNCMENCLSKFFAPGQGYARDKPKDLTAVYVTHSVTQLVHTYILYIIYFINSNNALYCL